MNDRGEKIVNLAREMLRADLVVDPPETAKASISFKVLCFATILTALGSSALTDWASQARRPLNRYERIELDALVFYAARLNGVKEDVLRHEIENRVGVSDFGDLTQRDYYIAKSYLQSEIH